ncbi:MAG: hypothetical protein R3D71_07495 [Rickettsiales bacterium]
MAISTENSDIAKVSGQQTARRSVGLESLGFVVAEGASTAVSLGTVAVADKLIPEKYLNKVSHSLSNVVIKPYQKTIEKWLDKCSIEDCKVDRNKSEDERADKYAKALIVFGGAWVLSMVAKSFARDKMNKVMNVNGSNGRQKSVASDSWVRKIGDHIPFINWSNEKRMIFAVDEGVHLGSLIFLNTKGSEITDDNIKTMSKALQKIGVSEKKAKDISTMAMVWEVPNALGSAAGLSMVFGKHAYGWPNKHQHQKFTDILSGRASSLAPQSIHT